MKHIMNDAEYRDYVERTGRGGKKPPSYSLNITKWWNKQSKQAKALCMIVTVIALIFAGMAIGYGNAMAALAPEPPKMTIYGFWDNLNTLQLPFAGWVVIFAFLWLTKW